MYSRWTDNSLPQKHHRRPLRPGHRPLAHLHLRPSQRHHSDLPRSAQQLHPQSLLRHQNARRPRWHDLRSHPTCLRPHDLPGVPRQGRRIHHIAYDCNGIPTVEGVKGREFECVESGNWTVGGFSKFTFFESTDQGPGVCFETVGIEERSEFPEPDEWLQLKAGGEKTQTISKNIFQSFPCISSITPSSRPPHAHTLILPFPLPAVSLAP